MDGCVRPVRALDRHAGAAYHCCQCLADGRTPFVIGGPPPRRSYIARPGRDGGCAPRRRAWVGVRVHRLDPLLSAPAATARLAVREALSNSLEFSLRPLGLQLVATRLVPVDDLAPDCGRVPKSVLSLEQEGAAVEGPNVFRIELNRMAPVRKGASGSPIPAFASPRLAISTGSSGVSASPAATTAVASTNRRAAR
jgi:hypothetical protein